MPFVTVLQMCFPILIPYQGWQDHPASWVIKVPAMHVAEDLRPSDETVFWAFVGLTCFLLLVACAFVFFLTCRGEQWAVDIIRLALQATSVAEYEVNTTKYCKWIPFVRWFRKLASCLVDVSAPTDKSRRVTTCSKSFFRIIVKAIEFTFVPVTIHLVGVMGCSLEGQVLMYPSFHCFTRALENKIIAASACAVVFYITSILLLCWVDVWIAARQKIAEKNDWEYIDEGLRTDVMFHPRFSYKDLWLRLAIVVYANIAGPREDYNALVASIVSVVFLLATVAFHGQNFVVGCWYCMRRSELLFYPYPSNVAGLNVVHGGALVFVLELACLVLLSKIINGIAHREFFCFCPLTVRHHHGMGAYQVHLEIRMSR
eukprot:gb/GECG01001786.1/.p1 GENE.gb/GECG01001786.1/~~gb/GECG01001786.1/.p1  ORF type:complete len:372 (+),score=4.23 gb/GECG01001786.1/:1-1116(+)